MATTLHRKFPVVGTKPKTRITAMAVLLLMVLSTWVPLNVLVYRNDDVTTRDLLDINSSLWSAQLHKTADEGPDVMTNTVTLNGLTSKLRVGGQMSDYNKNSTERVPGMSSAEAEGLRVEGRITDRPHHKEVILDTVSLPGIHTYLPHLRNKLEYLIPAVRISRNRTGVELVFGIPTIKRPEEDYLVETLNSLLSSISPQDSFRCLVIVFIAETDDDFYVRRRIAYLHSEYSTHVASGLLEIIVPKPEFYPDFEGLSTTLNDTKERFRWRSKQNLDYAYLMLYAHTKGNFYIQLEDDVITNSGVFRFIMRSLLWHRKGWFSLNFSSLGFIGKLFRTTDLPLIAEFLLMFYTFKPGDWLLENFMSTRVCDKNMTLHQCAAAVSRIAKPLRPAQFQHIGYHSSLKGKVQPLKMKVNFNPAPTSIETTILEYKKHRIEYAYVGQDYFWGMTPSKDDIIDFIYEPPIKITGYALVSGSPTNRRDVFPEDTTVEVLTVGHPNTRQDQAVQRAKTFQVVGHFDKYGLAQASLPASLGLVGVFRIHVNSNMTTWVALSNISIMQM